MARSRRYQISAHVIRVDNSVADVSANIFGEIIAGSPPDPEPSNNLVVLPLTFLRDRLFASSFEDLQPTP